MEYNANDYTSLCDTNQKVIVSEDKRGGRGPEHRAYNNGRKPVRQYKIDGVVIREEGKSCDFVLFKDDNQDRQAYLIELKGSDLGMAAEQLEATEMTLRNWFVGYQMNYRIVANRCKTHQVYSRKFQKFSVKWGNRLKHSTGKIEDTISQ